MLALALATTSCTDGAGTRSPTPSGPDIAVDDATVVGTPLVFTAVRVDPGTFLETELGTVELESDPPFRAKVIAGGPTLRELAAAQNALEFVTSSGIGDEPGTKVLRSSSEFFGIMRYGWLAQTQHVSLREPATASRAPVRRQLLARHGESYDVLGVVEIGDMDYVRIVGGPRSERARLGRLAHEMNEEWRLQVELPPPAGERGRWSRLLRRGTAEYRAQQRDRLLAEGFLILPEDVDPPSRVITERRSWLTVDVSGGLVVAPTDESSLVLSGPPGGPLSIAAHRYSGVHYDDVAIARHVRQLHGDEPNFIAGSVAEIELAERRLLSMSFSTGAGFAAANHLVVLWPRSSGPEESAGPADAGVEIEVTSTARDPLAAPPLVAVLESIAIDFERF